jgi:hypothetical protein
MPDTTPDAGTGTSSSLHVVESLDVKCMARVNSRQADDLPVLERKGGSSTMSDPEPGIQRTLVTIKPEDMLLPRPARTTWHWRGTTGTGTSPSAGTRSW